MLKNSLLQTLKIEDDSGLTNQDVEIFRISIVHHVALYGAFIAICHAMLPRVPRSTIVN